jgi:hypothetical protein
MHPTFRLKLFLALAAVFFTGVAAQACCGLDSWTRALPGTVNRGVVHGDKLFAVTAEGKLITVDLAKQDVKDLGNFGLKLGPQVAVVGQAVCVASGDQLHLIDPASGKCVRALKCGQVIRSFGGIDSRRLYVQGNSSFVVLNLDGKTLFTLPQASATKYGFAFSAQAPATADAGAKRLFVPLTGPKGGLGVIDLETHKLADVLPMPALRSNTFFGDIHAAGDRVYSVGLRYGYGVWTTRFGYVDLKTRQYTALRLPRAVTASTLVPGPAGLMYLAGPNHTCAFDAKGNVTSFRPQLPVQTKLLAFWQDNAVTVAGNRLTVAPLMELFVRAR